MDQQLHHLRKAEHRLVRLLLRDGLGYKPGSDIWKHMREGSNLLSFKQLAAIVPGYDLDLSYIQFSRDDRPTLKSLICCRRADQLVSTLSDFRFDRLHGRVFNNGGIKGGLIIHNFDLPSDRQSASMLWEVDGCKVRLQRFAEFCAAMRSLNWKLPAGQTEPKPVHEVLADVACSNLKPLAVRILLMLMSCDCGPQAIRDLQAIGLGVESHIDSGASYLVLPHADVGRHLSCDVSSVKRSLAELMQRRLIKSQRIGRNTGYRCNLYINWGGAK